MFRIATILIIQFFFSLQGSAQKASTDSIKALLNNASLTIGNDTIVSLPIVYKKDGIPFIKVIIEGKEYVFVFDTGASTCLISKEITDQAKVVKSISYVDANGKENEVNIILKDYKIGDAKFDSVATIVGDLELLSTLSCMKIDGIIGANLINLCNWQIDPIRQVISISKQPFKNVFDNSSNLKLEYAPNGLPHLKLTYDNIPFYALVDFGFAGYLELNKDMIKKSKKLKKIKALKGIGIHSFSANSVKKGIIIRTTIDTLVSENFKVANIPTNFDDVGPIIGASFFRRYTVTLNTSDKDLILSPLAIEDTISKTFPIKFGLDSSNELIINFIWETEELKQMGVKVGQKVSSIDNKVFNNLSNSDLCDLKNYLKEVSRIKIAIQMENKTKELELFKSVN